MKNNLKNERQRLHLTVLIRVGNLYSSTANALRKEITKQWLKRPTQDRKLTSLDFKFNKREIINVSVDANISVESLLKEVLKFTKKQQQYNLSAELLIPGTELWMDKFPEGGTLKQLGIHDGDIIVASLEYDDKTHLSLVPYNDIGSLFNDIVHEIGNITEDENSSDTMVGVLLYSDMDKNVALNVRNNFWELHNMSGSFLRIHLIEQMNWRVAMMYWKNVLRGDLFLLWSVLKLTATKPYERSQIYKIGYQLGILPEQFPCLVVYSNKCEGERLVFPVDPNKPNFRGIFSDISRHIKDLVPEKAFSKLKEQYPTFLTMYNSSTNNRPGTNYHTTNSVKDSNAGNKGRSFFLMPKPIYFKIALSFSGTRREYIRCVANELTSTLGEGSIFYDEYFMPELARLNLDTLLQQIYNEKSKLVVVFLCQDYKLKDWCGLEWRAIRELIKNRQDETIMLMRFDDTNIPGLFSTDGYIDISNIAPKEAAKAIIARYSSF